MPVASRHTAPFFYNTVLRMVSLFVLCRYVISGGSLFGDSFSALSSSSFDAFSSNLTGVELSPRATSMSVITTTRGGEVFPDTTTTTEAAEDGTTTSEQSIPLNMNLVPTLENGNDNGNTSVTFMTEKEDDASASESAKEADMHFRQPPKSAREFSGVLSPSLKDVELEDHRYDGYSNHTPAPTENTDTTTMRRQMDSYSNDTMTLAMASSSLLDLEHDAAVEWQVEQPTPRALQLDDMDHHLHHRHGLISTIAKKHNNDNNSQQYTFIDTSSTSITQQSDLTLPGRHVHIVTTAALPWMTGTAVNPLLRAAYLHRRLMDTNNHQPPKSSSSSSSSFSSSWVTLVIPWLELPEDQVEVYNGRIFANQAEQEAYIRNWLRHDAGIPDAADHLNIVFYPGRYHAPLGSVFAMGDIIGQLPEEEQGHLDVCILEEPEVRRLCLFELASNTSNTMSLEEWCVRTDDRECSYELMFVSFSISFFLFCRCLFDVFTFAALELVPCSW
jgi:hypothetical protein